MGFTDRFRAVIARMDDWYSASTGLGAAMDKLRSVRHRSPEAVVDDVELDSLYHHDAMAYRIVSAIPSEAMREGFRVTIEAEDKGKAKARRDALETAAAPGAKGTALRQSAQARRQSIEARGEASQLSSDVGARMRELGAQERLEEAWNWGRLFGGGLVLVGAQDGQTPDKPLNEAAIRAIDYLHVIDRRYVQIATWFSDPLDARYGTPETYLVTDQQSFSVREPRRTVHASRVITFGGARTSALMRATLSGWDLSVLERVYPQLQRYNANILAVSQLVQDASVGVLKMRDLAAIAAGPDRALAQERIELMARTMSTIRAILLDEGEEWERVATPFTGLPEVLAQNERDLASSVGWPHTFMFGRSPAGLNATGESDQETIENLIRGEQIGTLKARVERMVRFIFLSKDGPTGGKEPENWDIVFNPLRQSTPTERATISKTTAEAAVIWASVAGIPKEAILRAHFRPDGFVPDLQVDAEAVIADTEEEQAGESDQQESGATAEAARMKAIEDQDRAMVERLRAKREGAAPVPIPPANGGAK